MRHIQRIRSHLRVFPFSLGLVVLMVISLGFDRAKPTAAYPTRLSEYGLFQGDIARQIPAPGVVPYDLNTPLFSDYAEKLRFVKLPKGKAATYSDREVFDFPVGTIIIKTFYYPRDARKPHKGRLLLETRLLIHEAEGWKALPYHWNEDQTDASLEVAGSSLEVSWINQKGKKQKHRYLMPNLNQCKSCHSYDGNLMPIGPSARQLNGDFAYAEGSQNQLSYWQDQGLIADLPDQEVRPKLAVWNDPESGSLDERARAWLDINCAHCHNPKGPANTSGFFLDIHQEKPSVWGVYKSPVASGRGSGGFDFDIQPGQAERSILYYRINSNDPGVMMPEVGRSMIHQEGVALIKDWINQMPARE